MKHIIIPLSDVLGTEDNYLAAVPAAEKQYYGMVLPSDDPTPALIREAGTDFCWQYSACMSENCTVGALKAVFEQLRTDIDPLGGESFTLDLIVDAAHAKAAEKLLPLIKKAGQWYRIHIVFLSSRNSKYGKEQAAFLTKIWNDVEGMREDSGLGWTWFTMLADENRNGAGGETIRKQRKVLLPFLLLDDHANERAHTCYTYAATYQDIHFDQIKDIPRVQSIKYACGALQAREVYNERGILLMNGDSCPEGIEAQRNVLKGNLLKTTDLRGITGPDLLIQKHDPQADFPVRSLLEQLLRDNPEMDARLYDRAISEEQLQALPYVAKAVKAWDSYVIEQATKHTDLARIHDQLTNDSEWMGRISKDFQNDYFQNDPLQLCTSVLQGKLGYDSEAANSATNDLERVNQQLENAVFQACLRLMVLRLRHTCARLEAIMEDRSMAVKEMMRSVEGDEGTEKLIQNWCDDIWGKLTEISNNVPLYTVTAENSKSLIEKYAATLLDHLKHQIDVADGYAEMASSENTNRLMQTIELNTTPYQLINPALGNTCQEKGQKWYVYNKLQPTYAPDRTELTERQIVLLLTSFRFNPAGETAPDPETESYEDSLFLPEFELNLGIRRPVVSKQIKNESGTEYSEPQEMATREPEKYSMKFDWEYPDAETVCIRYFLFGQAEPIKEIQKDKLSFGGFFVVKPIPSLPSGARIDVEIRFLKLGHQVGKYSKPIQFETEKVQIQAEEETYVVKTGLFKKAWYHRFRVRGVSGLTGRICIQNAVSGCKCMQISWMQDGPDSVSEPIPEGGAWRLMNRPDSPYVYQLD